MSEQPDGEMAELDVMRTIAKALAGLDDPTKKRVLRWTIERFGVEGLSSSPSPPRTTGEASTGGRQREAPGESDTPDLPTVYTTANPKTQSEKALVVGYWFQVVQGQGDLDSQQINTALKNLGHGAANITRALEDLISTRPQLVIQTRKSGTSKQARKKYRLTGEGITRVKQMLAQPDVAIAGSGGRA